MNSLNYITDALDNALEETQSLVVKGRVTEVVGTIIKAVVPSVKIGEICILRNPQEQSQPAPVEFL